MAWAEKLPSKKYRGVYRDNNGKRRYTEETYGHKTKARDAAILAEQKARRRHGIDLDAAKKSWGEFVAEAWWPSRDVSDGTLRVDTYRLNKHLLPRWGDIPLGNIRKGDVRDWIVQMKKAGLSGPTSNRNFALLSASLKFAVERDILDTNPCQGIPQHPEPKLMERFLTAEEFAAIVEHLPTPADQLVATTLVTTGMRWGELAGLHWQRVDLTHGQIVIAETFPSNASVVKPVPKSKRPRAVPMTPGLQGALGAVAVTESEPCGVEHARGGAPCRSPLVFTTELGNPLRNSHWSVVWNQAVKRSGVGGRVRIHDLRHTYASWLLQAGRPIAEVSKLLGHSSIVTTERYAHLAADAPMDAVLDALRNKLGDPVTLELEAFEED